MPAFISTTTDIVLVNTLHRSGTISLPPAVQIDTRIFTIKDVTGNCRLSTCTIETVGSDLFEDSTAAKQIDTAFGFFQLLASTNRWFILNTNEYTSLNVSTVSASNTLTSSMNANQVRVTSLNFPLFPLTVSTSGFLYWGPNLAYMSNGPLALPSQVLFS